MVALGGQYQADPNNVQGDYEPVPPGEYRVHVKESDMVENSRRNGHFIKLDLEILDGEYAGRTLIERLNIDNPNQQAVDIAQRSLNAICVAVGKMSIADTNELHNIPMIAVVKVDPAKPYTDRDGNQQPGSPSNSIRTYKPIGSPISHAAPASQAATSSASAPWKRKAA